MIQHHLCSRKVTAIFASLVCSIAPGIAQQEVTPASNGFIHEIGVDFAPFLRGQQGVSLLYKHEAGQAKVGHWQKRNAVRILAGFYQEEINTDGLPYQKGDTTFVQYSTGDENTLFVNIGIERQFAQNKLRFYAGGDIGYRGSIYKPDTRIEITINGNTFPHDSFSGKVNTRTLEASAFGGFNFFFLPQFSIGLELNYSLGIEFSSAKIIRNGEETSPNEQTTFVGSADFPRLLYLSYHFGNQK
ncbi:MAG TPA: hypothetical protein PK228_03570 [Saprospiraceae bacterium]|nr:hypothetical protein [Saprospiraceae bacterium]